MDSAEPDRQGLERRHAEQKKLELRMPLQSKLRHSQEQDQRLDELAEPLNIEKARKEEAVRLSLPEDGEHPSNKELAGNQVHPSLLRATSRTK